MTSRGAEKDEQRYHRRRCVERPRPTLHRLAGRRHAAFRQHEGRSQSASSNGSRRRLHFRVVFEPTGPYHRAVERALGASGVPFVKVKSASRRAASPRRPASWRRPIAWMRRSLLAHGKPCWNCRRAPARSELFVRTEGALRRSRGPGGRIEPPPRTAERLLTLSLLKRQNAQRLEQIDRQIATRRSGHSPDYRSKRESSPIASPS